MQHINVLRFISQKEYNNIILPSSLAKCYLPTLWNLYKEIQTQIL